MRWKEQRIASILVAEELAVTENANIAETPVAAPPATPHTGDKNWYRAIVLGTFDTAARVIYADYGNSESVECSSILPIQEKHLELPFQVVKYALAAQRESPGEWPQSSVEHFKTLLQGRKAFASVQEFHGDLHTVHQNSCAEDESVNVAQMIVEDLSKSNRRSTTPKSVAQTTVEDLTNCTAAPTTTGIYTL
ncbi:tudor domain-containing protein 1-like [Polyodon spathula]|uniref:tudor domain-containing protein 1-like n=1 Tax=Polyodon spathula TaxID=7913 RepID=UPI001B7EACE8|nr:tudor domain-containing protein 1-like [Polyodon spathula]